MLLEPVEPTFPESAVSLEPAADLSKGLGLQPAGPPLAGVRLRDQSRALQHNQVLRDRLHAYGKRFRQLLHGRLSVRETREQRAPRRIRERGERAAEFVRNGRHRASPEAFNRPVDPKAADRGASTLTTLTRRSNSCHPEDIPCLEGPTRAESEGARVRSPTIFERDARYGQHPRRHRHRRRTQW